MGAKSRLSGNVRNRVSRALRLSHERYFKTPLPDNPHGVPTSVMEALAAENLVSDPVVWNARLQDLLREYKGG
jgi:hypothetical protein